MRLVQIRFLIVKREKYCHAKVPRCGFFCLAFAGSRRVPDIFSVSHGPIFHNLWRSGAGCSEEGAESYRYDRPAGRAGGDLEPLRSFDHADLSDLETCDRATDRMELEQETNCSYSRRVVEQSGP